MTPGYKTTEFWLKLAAIVLTALFASGAIPTTGTAAMIAAIAATVLGALGYTVSRTIVKTAETKAAANDNTAAEVSVDVKAAS